MFDEITINSESREVLIDITSEVKSMMNSKKIKSSGILLISSVHTTAGITINESADPAVKSDIRNWLQRLIPQHNSFKHLEGNSDAHLKTSLIGPSVQIPVIDGKLILGTWQGIFFCEFDGPRKRKVKFTFTGE
ncbi:MAG: secondary thiamine-phosphate synthase enzyme YjbQ [Myxococcota bacterium]